MWIDVIAVSALAVLLLVLALLARRRRNRGNSRLEALHTHPANFQKQAVEWVVPENDPEESAP